MILLDCYLDVLVQSLPWSLQSVFICPRKIELPLASPILDLKILVLCPDNGFVNKSVNWSYVWTCRTWKEPCWTRSRTKWRSICMCFMRECWTGLKLRCVAPRLSHSNKGVVFSGKPSPWRSPRSHIVSNATFARARYSIIALILAICLYKLKQTFSSPGLLFLLQKVRYTSRLDVNDNQIRLVAQARCLIPRQERNPTMFVLKESVMTCGLSTKTFK